ncbi:hypothetical protein [Paraburkholderia sp. GAS32]|uniref:hypothetical protein n=1 Tax=Paraburkholderia sp. GAS32 TaxID=3035129 RepID=UPI003D1C6D8F
MTQKATETTDKPPTGATIEFSRYCGEQSNRLKATNPRLTHAEVFAVIASDLWHVVNADMRFRSTVAGMLDLIDSGQWPENVAATKAPGDELAVRLEATFGRLIIEAGAACVARGEGLTPVRGVDAAKMAERFAAMLKLRVRGSTDAEFIASLVEEFQDLIDAAADNAQQAATVTQFEGAPLSLIPELVKANETAVNAAVLDMSDRAATWRAGAETHAPVTGREYASFCDGFEAGIAALLGALQGQYVGQ